MSKTPAIVEYAERIEEARNDDDESVGLIQFLREMWGRNNTWGPFEISEEAGEGGEGQGETAWYVYSVLDTRSNTIEYIRVDLSYYSYDGFQWSDVGLSDVYLVEYKEVTRKEWVRAD